MKLIITQVSSGKSQEMAWRRDGKAYNGTACSFLYNLARADRADFIVATEDGRNVPMQRACAAAAEEMNAIRNGRRIPAVPQF